ncbi:hypothetical protein GCM10022199_09440 [Marihabitans asiaticum]|uniref:Sulfotransferase domain-containing protein n=1 Tax=Marihabitans asiaticum TaxID=415218 RepID=A0A560WH04_9MICO|nr:sulfotransferase [Marihabitans asiaticum]TWD16971.1 sulfotransferase domain-containing protein [Marihabitans asiaticum]
MPLPNLLVVGSQKSGTSWLHHCLARSRHIYASKVKELNFFNQPNFDAPEKVAAFRAHFPEEDLPGVRYYLESTPHYFRATSPTAQNIRSMLGAPAMLAVFRHPVDRYESAYIHHMMQGRFAYTPVIDDLSDEYSMLTFGRYAEALERWWEVHPQLKPMIYDDLAADPLAFVTEIMEHLGLDSDLGVDDVTFRANDKTKKTSKLRLGEEWQQMPVLSPQLRSRLHEEYDPHTRRLEEMLGRDLRAWRS